MFKQFQTFTAQNGLCTQADKILIAVSGGADSVVLLHLLHKVGYKIALAHCNFNLRGEESDNDEKFVKNLCSKYNIKSHFISFNTKEFASKNKISIEMAARDLRYNWFNELCSKYRYTKIATGHHLNDSIETIFINLTRGTGINGLTGISAINGNIIRPLLFATRKQIEQYTVSEKLHYRNDSSNTSNKFVRNIIRNEIIPAFKRINTAFEDTMKQNLENINSAATIYNNEINNTKTKLLLKDKTQFKIPIKELSELSNKSTYLFEFISPFGFNYDTVNSILLAINSSPGKTFYSKDYKLLVDREFLLIQEQSPEPEIFISNDLNDFLKLPVKISANIQEAENFTITKKSNHACLDADQIKFPLVIRKWKTGDTFYPLGMTQKKKLSDFFIDQKIDLFQKEKIWIIESDGRIVWIVGERIDNRFKITDKTKTVLKLEFEISDS